MRRGVWTVICKVNAIPWPWYWMKSDGGRYGRVSCHSWEVFDADFEPLWSVSE